MVKSQYKPRAKKGCKEVFDEDLENALSDYEPAEMTSEGQYRCRDCGMMFDTLEEHDFHHRKIHSQEEPFTLVGMLVQ